MRILLKLHYAKFDVSRLFCSKVIEEKTFGGKGRNFKFCINVWVTLLATAVFEVKFDTGGGGGRGLSAQTRIHQSYLKLAQIIRVVSN